MSANKTAIYHLIKPLLLVALSFILVAACHQIVIQKPDALSGNLESPANCRVVQHTLGETCVPSQPKRIVVLLHHILGNVLSLGIKPIASNAISAEELGKTYLSYPLYLEDKLEGIEQIGYLDQPNLEKIRLLKPDLILAWDGAETIYPLLSQIAPTVLVPWMERANAEEFSNFIAEALGKEAEAQQAWNRYRQRVQELKTALGNQYQNQTISIVAVSGLNEIYIYAENSFAGSIFNDLELKRPKSQSGIFSNDGVISLLSEEMLNQVDGDILFCLVFGDRDKEAIRTIQQRPLWKKLKAVQKGQVYFVDFYAWVGSNPIAANVVLDDLYKYLVSNS